MSGLATFVLGLGMCYGLPQMPGADVVSSVSALEDTQDTRVLVSDLDYFPCYREAVENTYWALKHKMWVDREHNSLPPGCDQKVLLAFHFWSVQASAYWDRWDDLRLAHECRRKKDMKGVVFWLTKIRDCGGWPRYYAGQVHPSPDIKNFRELPTWSQRCCTELPY